MLRLVASKPSLVRQHHSAVALNAKVLSASDRSTALYGGQHRKLSISSVLAWQANSTVGFNAVSKIPPKAGRPRDPWKIEIDVWQLSGYFRDMQALAKVAGGPTAKNSNDEMQREFKSAERSLFPFLPENPKVDKASGQPQEHKVPLAKLKDVLAEENGRAWHVIVELAGKGRVESIDGLDEKTRAALEFCRVYGIGKTKAWPLVNKGYRSLADLEREDVKLTKAQRLGLKHLEDIERLIPRKESEVILKEFNKALEALKGEYTVQGELLGSYVRNAPYSSDIDYLLHCDEYQEPDDDVSKAILERVTGHLIEKGLLLEEPLSFGKQKWLGFGKAPGGKFVRRVDIRLLPMQMYPYAKLRSSGDTDFLRQIQTIARWQGLLLNEFGLGKRIKGLERGMNKGSDIYDPDEMIYVKTEEEVFKALGVKYIPAPERNQKSATRMTDEFKLSWKGPLLD